MTWQCGRCDGTFPDTKTKWLHFNYNCSADDTPHCAHCSEELDHLLAADEALDRAAMESLERGCLE